MGMLDQLKSRGRNNCQEQAVTLIPSSKTAKSTKRRFLLKISGFDFRKVKLPIDNHK